MYLLNFHIAVRRTGVYAKMHEDLQRLGLNRSFHEIKGRHQALNKKFR